MALKNIDATTNADMIGLDNNPTFTLSNATIGPSLKITRATVASATISLVQLSVSGASIPVFELQASSFVSAISIVFAASANWAGLGGIPVKLSGNGGVSGFIPVLPTAVFTAAAAS